MRLCAYVMPLMTLAFASACGGRDERIDAALRMQHDTVAVLVGAGDIADCRSNGAAQTARLLDSIRGTIFIAGDAAYASSRNRNPFTACYDATWGRHRARTRPSPGNHEYDQRFDPDASNYFDYFGTLAGPRGFGAYSYDLGSWHVVALNTNIPFTRGSRQDTWLRDDLESNLGKCTVAYMHHPRFSSGPHASNDTIAPLWRTLMEYGVSVVVAGHDHLYERFAPMDADGKVDLDNGMRQFVVGTGGAANYSPRSAAPGSEAAWSKGHGVLKLTLRATSYSWEFVPVPGNPFRDRGESPCRPNHAGD